MKNFMRGKYSTEENFERYKRKLNESYSRTLLYDFYMNYFISKNEDKKKLIQMHPLVVEKILKLSNDFIFAKQNKNSIISFEENKVKNSEMNIDFDTILYKGLFPLDISGKNYLYLKILKFHFGMMQFIDLYTKYRFDKLLVDDVLMNDYLNKKFLVCLDRSKNELKNKVDEFTDFQLISNVCVKERLTLYNFLSEGMNLNKNEIKRYINNQYINAFRGNSPRTTQGFANHLNNPDFNSELKNKYVEDIINPYSK